MASNQVIKIKGDVQDADTETQRLDLNPPTSWTGAGWRLLAYAMDKGPVFFVLLMILGAIGWGGHHAMTVAIPSHLRTIQEGYRENAAEFKAIIQEDRAERREQFKEMKGSFDNATEEFSRAVEAIKNK